jgi:outer membrane protein
MKIKLIFLLTICFSHIAANATNLLTIYHQALLNDTIYQQAISQRLSTKEEVPISLAALLPNLSANTNPTVTRSGFSGTNLNDHFSPRNTTIRSYGLTLTLTQTVFNAAQFAAVAGSLSVSKGADAIINAALQNLMVRVASAYFAILKDEDNLSYNEAAKLAYAGELDQVRQQYQVGLKTITDVYTAQASYDSAVASYIAAQTTLSNDKENLRVITGVYYPQLSSLSEAFPLTTPHPANVEAWVNTAQKQNWSIKAAQYAVNTSLQNVRQQFAGHLPTVSLEGTVDRLYSNSINGYNTLEDRHGPATETDKAIAININLPLFSGGSVIAQTQQASYNYQVTQHQLEQIVRNTINTTRQSYLNVISGVSQISADKQAIKSNVSSLRGMEVSYKVGTETLVNVLDQQQKLFLAQTQYATDRYAFVNNILLLKEAAGTLNFDDLRTLNIWLVDKKSQNFRRLSRNR